jgi:hypothetical protein
MNGHAPKSMTTLNSFARLPHFRDRQRARDVASEISFLRQPIANSFVDGASQSVLPGTQRVDG